jgi:hypothetical protein
MPVIWFDKKLTLDKFRSIGENTMAEYPTVCYMAELPVCFPKQSEA